MQKTLCITCCPLPSPAQQCVMLLVPSWYIWYMVLLRKQLKMLLGYVSEETGTKESCSYLFSGKYLFIPSKEIGWSTWCLISVRFQWSFHGIYKARLPEVVEKSTIQCHKCAPYTGMFNQKDACEKQRVLGSNCKRYFKNISSHHRVMSLVHSTGFALVPYF